MLIISYVYVLVGSKKRKVSKSVADTEKDQKYDGPSVTDYPFKSEKKKPRDIILSICVLRFPSTTTSSSSSSSTSSLSSSPTSSSDVRYLFVRRPDTGLLAGQWEFPTVTLYEEGSAGSGEGASTGAGVGMKAADGDNKQGKKKAASKKTLKGSIKTEYIESTTQSTTNTTTTTAHIESIRVKVSEASSIETCQLTLTELSSPFPAYFRSKLGLTWLDSSTSTTDLQHTAPSDTGTTGGYTPLSYIRTSPPSIRSTSKLKGDMGTSQLVSNEPIIHIFSHQRHIMHVLTYDILDTNHTSYSNTGNTANISDIANANPASDVTANPAYDITANAKFKLMTYEEAVGIGITSGVKKILHRVHISSTTTIPSSSSSSSSSTLMQIYNDNNDGGADAKATDSIGKVKKRGRNNNNSTITTTTTTIPHTDISAAAVTTGDGSKLKVSTKAKVKSTSTDKRPLKQLHLPFLPTTPTTSTSTGPSSSAPV